MTEAALALARRLPLARQVGILAIFLALVGFWLTLPPVTARTIAWPVALGAAAAVLAPWAALHGEKRLGWSGVVLAVASIVLGVSANQSSVSHLDQAVDWGALIALMFVYATPLTYA